MRGSRLPRQWDSGPVDEGAGACGTWPQRGGLGCGSAQSLSYTDGTSDPLPELVTALEEENRARCAFDCQCEPWSGGGRAGTARATARWFA
jgi:hypothetical protein